jgi:hypothetical protein
MGLPRRPRSFGARSRAGGGQRASRGSVRGECQTPTRFSPTPSTRRHPTDKASQLHASWCYRQVRHVSVMGCRFVRQHRQQSVCPCCCSRQFQRGGRAGTEERKGTNLHTNHATELDFRTCTVLLLSPLFNVHLHNVRVQTHAAGTLLAQRPADSLLLTASNLCGSMVAPNRTLL